MLYQEHKKCITGNKHYWGKNGFNGNHGESFVFSISANYFTFTSTVITTNKSFKVCILEMHC